MRQPLLVMIFQGYRYSPESYNSLAFYSILVSPRASSLLVVSSTSTRAFGLFFVSSISASASIPLLVVSSKSASASLRLFAVASTSARAVGLLYRQHQHIICLSLRHLLRVLANLPPVNVTHLPATLPNFSTGVLRLNEAAEDNNFLIHDYDTYQSPSASNITIEHTTSHILAPSLVMSILAMRLAS